MKSTKKKSSKRLDANKQQLQPKPIVFFVDRSLPRHSLPTALQEAGYNVIHHDERFEPHTPDEEWLRVAGEEGWVILTRDKRIRYNPLEKNEMIRSKAKVFVIGLNRNLRGEDVVSLIIKSLKNIERIVSRQLPPFIAKIYAGGEVKIVEK